jgi:ORF6N domain
MIDEDLAELYGVRTKRVNQQVSRNRKRFPKDFMFQLTKAEAENLRLQFATSRSGHGGRRSLPFVFTEQGVAMLSSVLNSEQAIAVNIMIMRSHRSNLDDLA